MIKSELLKNKLSISLLVGGLTAFLTAGFVLAGVHTFTAGVNDNFDQSDGPESASPSPALLSDMQNCSLGALQLFDVVPDNKCFGHTFDNLPGAIVSAELEIHMRAHPTDWLTQTDGFSLERTDPNPWWKSMNSLISWATGGAQTKWTPGSDYTFVLDLDNLPPDGQGDTSVINSINADHALDVFLQDDTGVDYITLTVCNGNGHGQGNGQNGQGHSQHGQGNGYGHCETRTAGERH